MISSRRQPNRGRSSASSRTRAAIGASITSRFRYDSVRLRCATIKHERRCDTPSSCNALTASLRRESSNRFFDECPYCVDLNRLASDDPLHLRVFSLELIEPGKIARFEPGVLVFPESVRIWVYAMTTTELRCRRSGLELFDDADDLRFGEAGLLHDESPWAYRPRSHSFDWGYFTPSGQWGALADFFRLLPILVHRYVTLQKLENDWRFTLRGFSLDWLGLFRLVAHVTLSWRIVTFRLSSFGQRHLILTLMHLIRVSKISSFCGY